jgi:formamidopyrimidine-DNA glycosylase
LANLGPEPLSKGFNAQWLAAKFAGRKAPVKALLLDQTIGAGVGNIYSDEALFLAKISPLRKAGSLKPGEISKLAKAVKKVLREAIAKIGCTFRDYRTSEGTMGGYKPRAYGRAGEKCKRCNGTVIRKLIGNRSSFFCPRCQV